MIRLSMRDQFGLLERSLMLLARDQVPFAASRALNDCARAAQDAVNARMGETFDRPTPFTRRAVVAPASLRATKTNLAATITVRPLQAKYLEPEELGGERSPGANTRRPGAAIVLPGRALLASPGLDSYGGIPSGALRKLKALARTGKRAVARRARQKAAGIVPDVSVAFLPRDAAANKAGIGGYFRREGRHLSRLTAFAATAHYKPRFHYREQVERVARATWPAAMARRLHDAIATRR